MRRVACLAALLASSAEAGPLRLRADALATTASPAGLLVLEADHAPCAHLNAEAVVWLAGQPRPGEDARADVLVIAVDARSPAQRVHARVGRFVSTLGALRATHVDGALVRVRLPYAIDAEAVTGIPVPPGQTSGRRWDWMAGGRVARRWGFGGSIGVAYAQRRDAGQLASEEVGVDAGIAVSRRSDLGARVAYDVANPGLAEVMMSASHRDDGVRTEMYLVHRSASHLLPATSLFSVLGDVSSLRAGTLLTWLAAPRLDVILDLGARRVGEDVGVDVTGRARLRLDDRGASVLGGELRRGGVGDDAWAGVRGTARIKIAPRLTVSAEVELVRPDEDRGRGTWWPWGLVAASWQRGPWQAAIASEASSTAEYRYRIDVLAQLARVWGAR